VGWEVASEGANAVYAADYGASSIMLAVCKVWLPNPSHGRPSGSVTWMERR